MQPFLTLNAVAAPLPQPNIDTDIIMPKQFLKRIDRQGLADGAFHDLRFKDGAPDPQFILNKRPYRDAKILVCGDNFGCGSSREYAVWGLMQLGIRAIIAPSIAGIFFGNCEKNGLLAVTLAEDQVAEILMEISNPGSGNINIDLPAQEITLASGRVVEFDIGPARKHALMSGEDHVTKTLKSAAAIREFEMLQQKECPWRWQDT